MAKPDYQEIINEYKEQVRSLRAQVSELEDAGKSKDAALKRALQKLEYTTDDLDKANIEISDATKQDLEKTKSRI
jgi:chromosome segregation ATPase